MAVPTINSGVTLSDVLTFSGGTRVSTSMGVDSGTVRNMHVVSSGGALTAPARAAVTSVGAGSTGCGYNCIALEGIGPMAGPHKTAVKLASNAGRVSFKSSGTFKLRCLSSVRMAKCAVVA